MEVISTTRSDLKRKRGEEEEEEELLEEVVHDESLKRQKSYKEILSILEEDEDEPEQDLSSLITSLQEEISSPQHRPNYTINYTQKQQLTSTSNTTTTSPASVDDPAATSASMVQITSLPASSSASSSSNSNYTSSESDEVEDEERERVMRRLLEASDDELGIPNNTTHTEDIEELEEQEETRSVAAAVDYNIHDIFMGTTTTTGDNNINLMFEVPPYSGEEALWEIEDEAANYYTLLQSELFM